LFAIALLAHDNDALRSRLLLYRSAQTETARAMKLDSR
jgi:hypothetical protein